LENGKKDELVWEKKSGWESLDKEEVFNFAERAKVFLNAAKTEKLAVAYGESLLVNKGFSDLKKSFDGEKVYAVNRGRSLIAAKANEGLSPYEGFNVVVAHVDVPRIDFKPLPLREEGRSGIVIGKTHYYGGIKKYQWVNIPLSVIGRVFTRDGKRVEVCIGEKEEDPVFVISDLLPHLSRKVQGERRADEVIKGEELNVLMGHIPFKVDDEEKEKIKEKVKYALLVKLKEDYGICERDLETAELELVPSFLARDGGLDRSFIVGYGQDDRICAFTSMEAFLSSEDEERIPVVFWVDKEEIGSESNTSAQSEFYKFFLFEILRKYEPNATEQDLRRALSRTRVISADVTAGVNPTFAEVHDLPLGAKLGFGVALEKYTGSRGKAFSNEATLEYFGEFVKLLREEGVPYQVVELGKVDEGGGGTVALFFARFNSEVLDAGVPVIGMHSPYEVTSKLDVYSAFLSYRAFYRRMK
jgi:aspartyl aminopeptidase